MESARKFKEKIRGGQICIGTNVTFTDLAVTEALCDSLDFVWIDMEHNPLSLEVIQGHIIATKGTDTAALVRVPWNDPVLIKPVLDIGAAGIIAPLVRTAEDVRRAVAACRYPLEGIRGYGPRRPSNYGRAGGSAYCRAANATVMCIVQIEHVDAVNNLGEILVVPGLDGIAVGPMDLSGSMGHMAEPGHPEVMRVIETILSKTRQTDILAGIAIGNDPEEAIEWIEKGAQWVSLGCDYSYLIETADRITDRIRAHPFSGAAGRKQDSFCQIGR
jgi:2-dehydro-3-deoxyglucarate aldolase/4-hydroxy-2-oxoheptanedioate aldolase